MKSHHRWIFGALFFLSGTVAVMAQYGQLSPDGQQSNAPVTLKLIELPPLPYAESALAPTISTSTMNYHYGKHHKAYVYNLNKLIANTSLAGTSLEEIIKKTADNPKEIAIFNHAAQVWNHTFFWNSMKPGGGGRPTGPMMELIEKSFGTYEVFRNTFVDAAVLRFGSGWVWLVLEDEKLRVITTSNAEMPRGSGQKLLLNCDIWEHAYYLDYQDDRRKFVTTFLDYLINWDFATSQLPK